MLSIFLFPFWIRRSPIEFFRIFVSLVPDPPGFCLSKISRGSWQGGLRCRFRLFLRPTSFSFYSPPPFHHVKYLSRFCCVGGNPAPWPILATVVIPKPKKCSYVTRDIKSRRSLHFDLLQGWNCEACFCDMIGYWSVTCFLFPKRPPGGSVFSLLRLVGMMMNSWGWRRSRTACATAAGPFSIPLESQNMPPCAASSWQLDEGIHLHCK